nr:TniQ family protein [Streptomyces sp. SID3343]
MPIRVAPLPGESLESWIDALAARHHTSVGEVLEHFGFAARTQGRGRDGERAPRRTIMLTGPEAEAITAATGVSCSAVKEMTLAHYDPQILLVNEESRSVSRRSIWGRSTGSRFCPSCLKEQKGRWQLEWRLGWASACVHHRRLLADRCPACSRVPRMLPTSGTAIPRPGLCGHPPPRSTGPFRRGCGFDLSETDSVRLEPDSPVLRAQTRIMEIFESRERPLAFGAYRHNPQPAPAVLLDIRALGSRFLTDLPREELVARLPAGLADAYLSCDDR